MMKHLAKKIGVCLALWCCLLFITALAFEDDEDGESVGQKRQVNFASVSAGAVVLESSPKANGYHHLLNDDKDKYGISPCAEKKWLVIGLSEDIVVEEIVVANYEKFSSSLETFQILSSTSFPATDWIDLGTFLAAPELGEQIFQINKPSWGRYLKFRFQTHHGDEFYCTLTQIKVHGSTVLENLKKEVERSSREVLDLENVILEEDEDSAAPDNHLDPEYSETGAGSAADLLSSATPAPVLEDESQGSQAVDSVQSPVHSEGSPPDANLPSSPLEFNPSLEIDSNHSPLGVLPENLTFDDLEAIEAVISQSNSTINSSLSESVGNINTVTDSNFTDNSSGVDTAAPTPDPSEQPPPVLVDSSWTLLSQAPENNSGDVGDSAHENLEASSNETDVEEQARPAAGPGERSEIFAEDAFNTSLPSGDSLVDGDHKESSDTPKDISSDLTAESTNSSSDSTPLSALPEDQPQPLSSTLASPAPDNLTDSPAAPDPSPPSTDVPLSSLPISKLKTCIDQLKFPEFQAKMRAKLVAGTHLLNQSNPTTAAELNQDVFRSLMKKISSLEQNSKIIELYLLQVSECQILLSKELDSLRTQEANELENATFHQLELNRTLEILLTLLPQEILGTQHTAGDDLAAEASHDLDVDHFHQEVFCEAQAPSSREDSPELLSLGSLVERCFLTQFPPIESREGSAGAHDVCIRLAVTFTFLSFLVSSVACSLVVVVIVALISRGRDR